MSLNARISLAAADDELEPEDFFAASLGVVFPDDVTNQHGDTGSSLLYTSPRLPKPLLIDLADPVGYEERKLFSHHLWNSSLLLAEFIERDTLGPSEVDADAEPVGGKPGSLGHGISFNVAGKHLIEVGAGTALPSIMAGILGAEQVVVTDYPAPAIMKTLNANVERNIRPSLSPLGAVSPSITVFGHEWGVFDAPQSDIPDTSISSSKHAFDHVLCADCLWMPWQHANLHRSIEFFLKDTAEARCWVVGGFHTGREKMRGFFDADALAEAGLELERIWERDCDGQERPWAWERDESNTVRKRWLVVGILKRKS
jgi:EEF1A N-terminal glycine/lysine methyltransferase